MVEGSWFEKLREIFKITINFNNFINIQINNNNTTTSSGKVNYDEEVGLYSINNKNLTFVERNKVKEIVKSAQRESITIILDETQEQINDIKLNEAKPEVRKLLTQFKDIIPPHDYIALRSAIYIDKLAREGLGYKQVYRMKGEVARKFGGRGLKICNIYAVGYFETVIKPLYEEFIQDGYFDKKNFLREYNIIINEEAFAIFVPDIMDENEVKNTIKVKIIRNLQYGRKDVTIHAKGINNKAKVTKAIFDIEEEGEYPIINKEIEETQNTILAQLYFR